MIVRERPAAGQPEGALVLLHGRGADEHDLFPLLDALDPERRLHGYTPRGPLSLPPGGAHWYVVPRVGYPDPETFWASYREVGDWIESLPYEHVVLGGFSQGAVMSYALGLGPERRRPLAIVAFSGFIPTVDGWRADLEPPLPQLTIAHGSHDPVIDVSFAHAARDLLIEGGADVEYCESPAMGHSIDPATIVVAGARIASALA